jgi:hypothetical protein
MTTVYNDYYKAYDSKAMDVSNVNFLAILADFSYIPKPTDKLDNVKGVIIVVPYVITSTDIVKLGMNEIMAKAEADIRAQIKETPEQVNITYRQGDTFNYGRYIVMFNPELEILCFAEPVNENLKTKGNG